MHEKMIILINKFFSPERRNMTEEEEKELSEMLVFVNENLKINNLE